MWGLNRGECVKRQFFKTTKKSFVWYYTDVESNTFTAIQSLTKKNREVIKNRLYYIHVQVGLAVTKEYQVCRNKRIRLRYTLSDSSKIFTNF